MQELIKTLDENLKYIDSELVGDTMQIRVESNREEAICPHCGQGSSRVHIRHQRVFQDMPVMGHKSQIFLESRKMFCDNPDCKHTTFAERFDFLKPKARRTNRLTDHVLESAVGASSVLTAKTLRKGTCEIGKSTICNLLKKKRTDIDKSSVTHVCIDDFAIRKGQTYGTCMTDALTHRIIDMIPSRGLEETTAWLAEYPNLKVIVRDGSLTYRSAADKAHPEAIQVGDRFHILKNVTEAAIKYLRRLPNLKTE